MGVESIYIVAVKTKRQITFPFSEIITQINENKSSFERGHREICRLVVTSTIMRFVGALCVLKAGVVVAKKGVCE